MDLRKTECINEIIERLAKLPSVTPKLWVHAKKSSTVFNSRTQVGRTSGIVLTPKWGFPVAYKNTAAPTISTLPYIRAV